MEPVKPEEATPEVPANNGDWQLEYLVDMANFGFCPGITLTTAAGLITGILIPGEEYFDRFAVMYSHGMTDEYKAAFAGVVDDWKQPYRDARDSGVIGQTSHIHLKDAKLFSPGGIIPGQGMLWRGRIDQVIGFTLGSLVP